MAFRGNKRVLSPSQSAAAGMVGPNSMIAQVAASTMSLPSTEEKPPAPPAALCASSSEAAMAAYSVNNQADDVMRSRSHTFSGRSDESAPAAGAAAAAAATSSSGHGWDETFSMDWSQTAVDGNHMWGERESARENCYVCGDGRTRGPFLKCHACKVIVHAVCTDDLASSGLTCRPSFREYATTAATDDFTHRHHWVNQRRPTGKCAGCAKAFNPKFAFTGAGGRDFAGVGCSWCKLLYHNNCFRFQLIDEPCTLGEFSSLILPPACVVRLPKFDESSKRRRSVKRRSRRSKEQRYFTIQPQKAAQRRPLLVFVNPKSGGNQGAKLLAKFVWLLNPRQVFNLLDGGPQFALRLFARVQRARILVCGGDGTIGWILSAIDQLKIRPCPPIAVLPIGTGNDLARTLNWGSGYQDEALTRILHQVDDAAIIHLDRWDLQLTPLAATAAAAGAGAEDVGGVGTLSESLPLTVMNNYFSMGADALVVLEFHESREAKPERFNSRWYNKIYYAQAGGKELFERKLRDLFKHVELVADGVDLTPRIREEKVAALAFVNISRYSAGTQPWGIPPPDCEFGPTLPDDGKFEILGFTTPMMATLHMGSHGIRLAQCAQAVVTTKRPIPVQVDGEPCRLAPSTVTISFRNRACMLQRVKRKDRLLATMTSYPASLVENRFQQTDEALLEGEFELVHPNSAGGETSSSFSPPSDRHIASPVLAHFGVATHRSLTAMSPCRSRSANSSPLHSPGSTTRTKLKRLSLSSNSLRGVGASVGGSSSSSEGSGVSRGGAAGIEVTSDLLNGAVLCFRTSPTTDHRHSPHQPVSLSPRNGIASMRHQLSPRAGGPPVGTNVDSVDDILEEAYGMPTCGVASSKSAGVSTSSSRHSLTDFVSAPSSLSSCSGPLHPHHRDSSGGNIDVQRALFNACRQGHMSGVVQATSLGASLMGTDEDGLTALHLATRHNRKYIVSHILSHLPKSAVDQLDPALGQTALHKATWHGYPEMCQLLVEAGASLTIPDGNGNTPYMLSQKLDNIELQKFMFACEQRQRIKEDPSETAV